MKTPSFAVFVALLSAALLSLVGASPYLPRPPKFSLLAPTKTGQLQRRTNPVFPDDPPSCPICAKDYDKINSCAEAAPVLANFSMILFNPLAFIDVIQCACTDTFRSAFPQCVDCFQKTGQTELLNTDYLPSVVDGLRDVCALASTLSGNVSNSNNETTPRPSPTPTGGAASLSSATGMWYTVLAASVVGLATSLL